MAYISVLLSGLSMLLTFLLLPIITFTPFAAYLGYKAWNNAKKVAAGKKQILPWLEGIPFFFAVAVFIFQVSTVLTGYRA
jgi:uncharacterized membrane protein YidH (DUF202 family)